MEKLSALNSDWQLSGPISELHVMTDRCLCASVQSESSTWFPGEPEIGGGRQEKPHVDPRRHGNRYRRLQGEGTVYPTLPVCEPV